MSQEISGCRIQTKVSLTSKIPALSHCLNQEFRFREEKDSENLDNLVYCVSAANVHLIEFVRYLLQNQNASLSCP